MHRSLFRSLTPIALLCAGSLATSLAGATEAPTGSLTFAGYTDGNQSVNVSVTSPAGAVNSGQAAGGFLATLDSSTASFTTYCVDLYQYIGFGTAYTDYNVVAGSDYSFVNSNANVDIGKLYAEGNVINDATTQAAFQIAVWELAYETSGKYDLSSGNATFSGGSAASSGALTLASSWLDGLSSVSSSVGLSVYASAGHQDQVTPVPEPETYGLMAAGMAVVGFFGRRRAAQQQR